MKKNEILDLSIRYILLIILPIGNLALFYAIFTPLTAFPSYLLLKLTANASFISPTLFQIGADYIQLIPACIAGSAYYFLLALNLLTPLKFSTRIKSILFLWISFLIFNILRITILANMVHSSIFDITHRATWYVGSTAFVVILWFVNVKIFNITSIPFYTDAMKLYSKTH